MSDSELKELLVNTALYYGHEIPDEVLLMYVADLRDIPLGRIARALVELRRDPKVTRCPLPAQIRDRVGDGRPPADEAWAMIPKDEHSSVVWTEEMAQAFGIARGLLADQVAARMAFKESYARLVAEARAQGRPAAWSPSFGLDSNGHEAAVKDAFDRRRISAGDAQRMLPLPAAGGQALLEGPEPAADPQKVRELLRHAMRDAPPRIRAKIEAREVKELSKEELRERQEALKHQARIIAGGGES